MRRTGIAPRWAQHTLRGNASTAYSQPVFVFSVAFVGMAAEACPQRATKCAKIVLQDRDGATTQRILTAELLMECVLLHPCRRGNSAISDA
jgi:hypothetical protein